MTNPPKSFRKSFVDAMRSIENDQMVANATGRPIMSAQQTGYARSSGKSNTYFDSLLKQAHDFYMPKPVPKSQHPPGTLDDFMLNPDSYTPPVPYRDPNDVEYIRELANTNDGLTVEIVSLKKIITEMNRKLREIEAKHKDELVEMQDRIDDLNTQLYLKDV